MSNIEIKRGYEVLSDNSVRFGIKIINNSESAISDVEIFLDYSSSLFKLEGNRIQNLGTIHPTVHHIAEFILKPLSCIHKAEIGATIRYKDHLWKRHMQEMRLVRMRIICSLLLSRNTKA